MKALVLESNGVLNFKEVGDPIMRDDECLVRVKAAGICNSDIYRAFENGAYHYPLIMGHEFSGEIVECGKKVHDFYAGQEVVGFPLIPCFKCEACMKGRWVYCENYDYYGSRRDGAFAEGMSIRSWNLMPAPDGCDLALMALTEPLAVAIHASKRIPKDKGGKLLILGAGFIGLSCAKLAQNTGRFDEIWVFDRNQFKLEMAERFGFLTSLTPVGGEIVPPFENSFDVVIEACGAVATYRTSVFYGRDQAQLIWIGNIQGELRFSKTEISSILRKELDIHGVWNSEYQPNGPSDWKDAVEMIKTDDWIKNLVMHSVPLSEGKELLESMYEANKHVTPHSFIKTCLIVE